MTDWRSVERKPLIRLNFRMLSFELSREPFIDCRIKNRRAESEKCSIRFAEGLFVGKQAIRIRACRASSKMKRLKTGLFRPTNHLSE